MDGPAQRLPPDVVVSDRGKVSREAGAGSPEEARGDGGAGRAVGIDGRPMTRAGSNAGALVPPRVGAAAFPPLPPPSPRTNWTRLVPRPVLTGHVSSLAPY